MISSSVREGLALCAKAAAVTVLSTVLADLLRQTMTHPLRVRDGEVVWYERRTELYRDAVADSLTRPFRRG